MAYRSRNQTGGRGPRTGSQTRQITPIWAATASDRWQYPDEQDEGGSAPFLTELPSRAVTSGKRAERLSSRLEADVPGAGPAVLSDECGSVVTWRPVGAAISVRTAAHDQDRHQKALVFKAMARLASRLWRG